MFAILLDKKTNKLKVKETCRLSIDEVMQTFATYPQLNQALKAKRAIERRIERGLEP